MIKSNISPEQWSLKHNIPISEDYCRKCGEIVKIDQPVISRDFVGFESISHECGQEYVISILKPNSKEMKKHFEELNF